jgi:prepilin-type N-terminal cleavage/methylation domain-containing protein
MLTRNRRRPAFTLVELLVVVSIIAILVALTATAAFGVRRNMQNQNSEATLQKLDTKVQQKVKDIRDRIQDEVGNKSTGSQEAAVAMTAAGNDKEGAKSIMLYARLKQQLPMSFAEARTPFPPAAAGYGFTYQPSPAFNGLPMSGSVTLDESAACLYAAIAPMGLEGLEQQVGTNAAGQKVFVDGFGTPIGFIRIAYDGNLNELNTSPQTKNANQDPYDPSGKAAAVFTANPTLWTSVLGPQLTDAGTYNVNAAPYRTTNRNHSIALISAGATRKWIDAPATSVFDGDNLFSYRLRREGKHGD